MAREIKQIAVSGAEDTPDSVYALASDGTLWCFVNFQYRGGAMPRWERLPALPQED